MTKQELNTKLNEFISQNEGKFVEVAGTAAQNQCVDLANKYIRDVLGFPMIEWTNAIDFPSKGGDRYEWIPNDPYAIPEPGDLMIFKGQYGHISVFVEGNVNYFVSFDQNWPTGSVCRKVTHNYSDVLGWMRPKLPVPEKPNMNDKRPEEFDLAHKALRESGYAPEESGHEYWFENPADPHKFTNMIKSLIKRIKELEKKTAVTDDFCQKQVDDAIASYKKKIISKLNEL